MRENSILPENGEQLDARPPISFWLLLYCSGLALTAPKIAGLVFGSFPMRDFTNLWVAGKMALSGPASEIYDISAFQVQSLALAGIQFDNSFSYPPHTLLLAAPFATLPLAVSYALWNFASLAFFYWAARPYTKQSLPAHFAILTPASLICLLYGHYTLFLGGLWLLAFRPQGLAAAAMTIKPHFGLLSAIHLFRHPAQFAVAVAGTLTIIVVSIGLLGIEAWQAYLTSTIEHQSIELVKATRPSYATSMVAPHIWFGWLGHIAFALAAIFLLYRDFNVFTAASATFLISPYGYFYDLTVICLAFAILLGQHWSRLNLAKKMMLSAGFLVPGLMISAPWIAPPLLLIGMFLQVKIGYTLPAPAR